jgi:uncharacterized protein YjgD (DUF1641 family)
MAEPIQHTLPPPRIGPDAREEFERLLQTCHEHGLLRLLNDLVASNAGVAKILVEGLQSETMLNLLQNTSALCMALSRVPPEQCYRLAMAAKDGCTTLAAPQQGNGSRRPPGLIGTYRMLHDESLWHALAPLLDALRAFSTRLEQPVQNPISDFSGKPGSNT